MIVRAPTAYVSANRAVMSFTFLRPCATCGYEADADPGYCPGCGTSAGPPTLAETWNRDHPSDPMLSAPPARRAARPRATWSRSPRASARPPQGRRSQLALASLMACILLAVTLLSTVLFGSGSSKPSTSETAKSLQLGHPASSTPSRTARRRPRGASRGLGAHRVFAGRAFSVAYPRGWAVERAEAAAPWGSDTTIVAPRDPRTILRVDVTAGTATSDPITAAEPVIATVAREPGYRELGLTTGTFHGRQAARWEFVVAESGVLVHKQDVFFTSPNGTAIAILTAARAADYAGLAKRFTAMRRSLAAH